MAGLIICGIWGCALFEICEMKKGASLLAMENQQNGALIFGKLFKGNPRLFSGNRADSKRAQPIFSVKGAE